MKHAGIHWPENAGGEHPNRDAIISMPGMAGATLICSPSARYHYDHIRKQQPSAIVVWRAIPRVGKLPAQLGWDGKRVADECLNLWDEQPHGGIEWFTPLNELQFLKEAGENFRGYGYVSAKLADLRVALQDRFRALGQTVRLVYPAWVPMDDGDHLDDWRHEANNWDVVGVHCYGSAETMRARYQSYRDAFPGKLLFAGEWNSNHEGHDERASLEMWAAISDTDPLFLGAAYYIWETNNAGERDLSIWGNPDRLALFRDPPTASIPAPTPAPEPKPAPMPTYDPWKFFTAEALADATECPLENVRGNWPKLVEQMGHAGIADDLNVYIALAGTIAKESASSFAPVREAFFLGEPEPAESWRRTNLRYYPYYGRGFIQITWESNYRAYGRKVAELWGADPSHPDFDLVGNPDRALAPDISAAVSVLYFRDHGGGALLEAARAQDWPEVRRLVLGGPDPDGVRRLERVAAMLGGGTEEPTVPTPLPYNPDAPIDVQPNDWSCALQSVQWLLRSIGRNPDANDPTGDPWLTSQLVPGIISPQVGLQDASGAQLAAWLNREYGAEMGFTAHHAPVTFDDVLAGAGTNPTIVGGRRYGPGGHWVGIRRADADGLLELANPAPNFTNTGTHLDRAEWDARGPWSAIYIDRMSSAPPAPEPAPEPPIVPPPAEDTRVPRAMELLRQALAVLSEPAA